MTTLVIIAIIIFVTYLTAVICLFGIPASISDSYYLFENKRKGFGWLFTAMCWIVGGLLLPALLEMTPDNYQFTAFLACAGLIFVGTAPQFKLSLTGSVHYSGAAVCVLASQVWVGFICWWILILVWIAYISGTIIYMIKHISICVMADFIQTKPMTWIEVSAFTAFIAAILLRL